MPKDFDTCVAQGGRVITKPIGPDKEQYIHLCKDKQGHWHKGEVKIKKKEKKK